MVKKMNDDVTLSYYNVFFVIIYYATSIFMFIILLKLRGYLKTHIREVIFSIFLLIVNAVQYNILANGGILIYIFPHYFSIYDYRSIRFGALFFLIAYCFLMPVSKSYSEEEEKQSGNNGKKNE